MGGDITAGKGLLRRDLFRHGEEMKGNVAKAISAETGEGMEGRAVNP